MAAAKRETGIDRLIEQAVHATRLDLNRGALALGNRGTESLTALEGEFGEFSGRLDGCRIGPCDRSRGGANVARAVARTTGASGVARAGWVVSSPAASTSGLRKYPWAVASAVVIAEDGAERIASGWLGPGLAFALVVALADTRPAEAASART